MNKLIAQCKEPSGSTPTRERYRCWDPADGTGEQCADGKANPGYGGECGRDQSDICYELDTEDCNTEVESSKLVVE